MKKFFSEFKSFIQKGNVLDLAIGMIIGTAFNSIVKSLVNDIIMPLISVFFKVNINELKVVLVDAVLNAEGEVIKNQVTLNYGSFLQSVVDFLIIAFSIFVAIKLVIRINKRIEMLRDAIINKEQEEETKVIEEVVEEVAEVKEPTNEERILECLVSIKSILEEKE